MRQARRAQVVCGVQHRRPRGDESCRRGGGDHRCRGGADGRWSAHARGAGALCLDSGRRARSRGHAGCHRTGSGSRRQRGRLGQGAGDPRHAPRPHRARRGDGRGGGTAAECGYRAGSRVGCQERRDARFDLPLGLLGALRRHQGGKHQVTLVVNRCRDSGRCGGGADPVGPDEARPAQARGGLRGRGPHPAEARALQRQGIWR
mmetsp:Transcript_80363/g.260473  ORF Transcript_80363/g.260473 Transcript_80363/m.260473 type:complete len:204 (-) Transcript_80363:369-980(-)